ncbi:uncharacterized protein LOC141806682 [Halichoeres trimaculatus]|uniref:uncharacterized protein LOC141806682 n=1 Tax=Halichoeres trimaculatus TaxID=147232 RepID=UPI003D9EC1FF
MKAKWCLYILWSVLSLGLLSCAADTSQSPIRPTKGRKVLKLGTPKPSSSSRLSYRSPDSTAPLPQLSSPRQKPPQKPAAPRSREPLTKSGSGFAYLPDVSVSCSTSDFVVRVKPAFYGLGAEADELKLGSSCKSNGVLSPYGDLLFTYPLTACDAVRQLPPGYLVYKFILHYEPSSKRFPSRAHHIDVNIECRYQRNHHVYQLTVQPTWETAVVRKRLNGNPSDFQMQLMDNSWSKPRGLQVYQLGRTVHFQVSAPSLPAKGKLYISSCYAAPSTGFQSSLKYIIIDNFGCMIDSKRDPGASQFVSRTDKTLRFSLKAFQFTSDPDTEVSIHCKLFVTSEDPSPAHKSCTYIGNRWKALTGDDSICECCDSQCVTSKPKRAMMEGSVSSGSLLVSDQPQTAEGGFPSAWSSSVSRSTDGHAIISHYINELHGPEDLLESVGVVQYEDEDDEVDEDEEEDGWVTIEETEPDLEDGLSVEVKGRPEVRFSPLPEDEGSGYLDSTKSEDEEGREDDVSVKQQEEAEVIRQWVELEEMLPTEVSVQTELQQQAVSEDEEENFEQKGQGEEDVEMEASEVEWRTDDDDDGKDKEQTWFFSWR